MDRAKQAVSDFISRDGKTKTTVDEDIRAAVTEEHIRPHQHDEVTTAIDKDVHVDHHHTTVQPVLAKEQLAEEHHHNMAPVEHKTIHHGNESDMQEKLQRDASQYQDSSTTHHTTHSSSAAPVIEAERTHHHVHEHVQPIVQKEVIAPQVIHTTVPIHETHHASAQHHGTSVLPAKTLEEFKGTGATLQAREATRVGEFDGTPKAYDSSLQREQLDGDRSTFGSDHHSHHEGHHHGGSGVGTGAAAGAAVGGLSHRDGHHDSSTTGGLTGSSNRDGLTGGSHSGGLTGSSDRDGLTSGSHSGGLTGSSNTGGLTGNSYDRDNTGRSGTQGGAASGGVLGAAAAAVGLGGNKDTTRDGTSTGGLTGSSNTGGLTGSHNTGSGLTGSDTTGHHGGAGSAFFSGGQNKDTTSGTHGSGSIIDREHPLGGRTSDGQAGVTGLSGTGGGLGSQHTHTSGINHPTGTSTLGGSGHDVGSGGVNEQGAFGGPAGVGADQTGSTSLKSTLRGDNSTTSSGIAGNAGTMGSTEGHKPSLADKLNPFKDTDGDGKKGFMK